MSHLEKQLIAENENGNLLQKLNDNFDLLQQFQRTIITVVTLRRCISVCILSYIRI